MKFDVILHGVRLKKNDSSPVIANLDKVLIREIKGSDIFHKSKKSNSTVVLKKQVEKFALNPSSSAKKPPLTVKEFTAEVRKCFGENFDRYRLYGNNPASQH